MKKILLLIPLIFLVGCASIFGRESPPPEIESSEIQGSEKDSTIADLEYQVRDLTETLNSLQVDYYALQTEFNENEANLLTGQDQSGNYLCETRLENMKYQDPVSTIAILEGWFALQDQVEAFQGTYSTELWIGVESRMHTISYISSEGGLPIKTSFLIFFEEAGWSEGLLWITEQCWLDFPD